MRVQYPSTGPRGRCSLNMMLTLLMVLISVLCDYSDAANVPANVRAMISSSGHGKVLLHGAGRDPAISDAIRPSSYAEAEIDRRHNSRDLKAGPQEMLGQDDVPTRHKRGALINWFRNFMHKRKGPANRLSSGIITHDPFGGNNIDSSLNAYLKNGLPSGASSYDSKHATSSLVKNNDESTLSYGETKSPEPFQGTQPVAESQVHQLEDIHIQIPVGFNAPGNESPFVQNIAQSASEPEKQTFDHAGHGYGQFLHHSGDHHQPIGPALQQEEYPRPLFPAYAYAPQLELVPQQADPAFFANLLYDGPPEPTGAWTFPPAPATPESTTPSSVTPTEVPEPTIPLDSQSQVLLDLANQLLSLQQIPLAQIAENLTKSTQPHEEAPRTAPSPTFIDEASTEVTENVGTTDMEQNGESESRTPEPPMESTSETSPEPSSTTQATNGISINGNGLTPEEIVSLEHIAQLFGLQLGNFGPTPDPLTPEEAMIFNTLVDMAFAMLGDRLKAQNMDPLVVDFSVPVTKLMNSSFLGELLNDKIESNLLDDLLTHLPLPEDLLRQKGLDVDTKTDATLDRNAPETSAEEQELVPAEESSELEVPSSSSSSDTSPGDYSSSSSGSADGDATTTTTTTVAPKDVNKIKRKNKPKNKGKKKNKNKKKHHRSRLWPTKTRAAALSGFFRKKPPVSTVIQRVSATMIKQGVAMAEIPSNSTETTSETTTSTTISTDGPKRPGMAHEDHFEPPTVLQSKASVQVTQDGEFQGLSTLKRVSDVELDDEFNGVRHFKCYFAATNVTFLARLHVDERVDLVTSYDSFRYSNSSRNSTVKLSRLPVLSGSIRFSYGEPDGSLKLESVKVYPPDTAIFLHQKMLDDYTEAYAVDMLAFLGQTLKGEVKTLFTEVLEGSTSIFYGNHSSTEIQASTEMGSSEEVTTEVSSATSGVPVEGAQIHKNARKNTRRRKVQTSSRRRHHKAMLGPSEPESALSG